MGSRDRPSREAKKKPKDKGGAQAAAADGAAAERRADPQAAQAEARGTRRPTRADRPGGSPSRCRSVERTETGARGDGDDRRARARRATASGTASGAGERGKAVDAAILAIEKQFGRGSIMKLGSAERQSVDSIPTGSIALDLALGVGGIPRGRITEIFGPESSGKTTRLPARHRRGPARAAAWPPSSTSSTRSIRATPGPAASTSTSSSSASRTPASRPSRSPRR